eukprot:bmy_19744T0
MGHFTKPQQVQEERKAKRQSREKAVPAGDKLKDHYQDISKALTKLDNSKNGYISLCKMQKLLQDCGCPLKEEELADLLNRFSMMRQYVSYSTENQAFSALDKEDTGFVKASDFGQVLKDFCYKLTDTQYHYFLRKLRIHLTPYINWKYFLQNFNSYLEE